MSTNQTNALTVKDLWLDANQGETREDRAFGYIGTNEEYETGDDGDGDSENYCGWFFTWPGSVASISTEQERESVLDSLDLDETERHHEAIPAELAREKLDAYLAKKFGNLEAE